jgi:hypothetical protein
VRKEKGEPSIGTKKPPSVKMKKVSPNRFVKTKEVTNNG